MTEIIMYIQDYPELIGNQIQQILKHNYTITGEYSQGELSWYLIIRDKTDAEISMLMIALGEYLISVDP